MVNIGDAKVTVVSLLSGGMPTAIRAHVEHTKASSPRLFATGELYTLMPTRCLTICSDDDTTSQTSAFMPNATPSSPSTATLLDLAIFGLALSKAAILVRVNMGDFTTHQLFGEMTLHADVNSEAWPWLSAGLTLVFAPTRSYLDPAPPLTMVPDTNVHLVLVTQLATSPVSTRSRNPISTKGEVIRLGTRPNN